MPTKNPNIAPLELGPDKVNTRLPYGSRFHALQNRLRYSEPIDMTECYREIPDVPENLCTKEDLELSAADKLRMVNSEDWRGDPVADYQDYPKVQAAIISQEHAMARLERDQPHVAAALAARHKISRLIVNTALVDGSQVMPKSSAVVRFKPEYLQGTKSFKERGAALAVHHLFESGSNGGVAAASAGNHAQGLAKAANAYNMPATVFMSVHAEPVKADSTAALGATVIRSGENYDESVIACNTFVGEHTDVTTVHAYDDPVVMTGQSTLGVELIVQEPHVDHAWFASGGGGLISKNAAVIKEYNPHAKVYAVVMEGSDSLRLSLAAGKVISIAQANGWCDGTAVRAPGSLPFDYIQKYVDEVKVVSKDQALRAMYDYYRVYDAVIEPAAAIVLAAMQNEQQKLTGTHVGVLGGGNASKKIVNALKQSTSFEKFSTLIAA